MKKTAFAIALVIASLTASHAQTAPAPYGQMHYLIGMGVTAGGDKLATASYTNGTAINIKAGSGVVFAGGVEYRVNPSFSLQSTVNFHVDDTNASNGSIKFQRFPIELVAYYHAAAQWRVGAGARYVSSPKLSSSGAAANVGQFKFENTVSALVEAEYLFAGSRSGVKLRYVSEKMKVERTGETLDANHIGIFANYYF